MMARQKKGRFALPYIHNKMQFSIFSRYMRLYSDTIPSGQSIEPTGAYSEK